MAVRTMTALEVAEMRIGPRARSLRENVEIEKTEVDLRAPRFAPVPETKAIEPEFYDPNLDDQQNARERSARADNRQRQAALLGRADLVRSQLAQAWSSVD